MRVLAIIRQPNEPERLGEIEVKIDEPALRIMQKTPARIVDEIRTAIQFVAAGRFEVSRVVAIKQQAA